jgi:glycosyltransferase involved in cell wall biosynthesis
MSRRVVIVQEFLTHYRVDFFAELRERLAAHDVDLDLVVGAPNEERSQRSDAGELPWATRVRTRHLSLPRAGALVWLPALRPCLGADLVVVEQGNRHVLNYLLLAARKVGGPRVALWGHGRNRQSRRPHGVKERWKRRWLRRPDWWFAYTASVADEVVAAGFPRARMTVVQNSIRPAATSAPVERVARVPGRCVFVGSLYDDKRLDVLVAAGDVVARRVANFGLDIVGEGPGRAFVVETARSRPWLDVVGALREGELASRLASAELALMPGLVGLAVIEAFAAGTPVVTMEWEHHSPEFDYLENGVNAVVLPAGTTAAEFGAAVAELLADPARLQRLRDGCRVAAATYTLAAMVDNFAAGVTAALDA